MQSDRLPQPAPWVPFAACRGRDTDTPPVGLCASCTVRPQCLSFALDLDIREGRWGGLLVDERDALLEHHGGDVYAAVNNAPEVYEVDPEGRAQARARHPSLSPDARAQLALELDDEDGGR